MMVSRPALVNPPTKYQEELASILARHADGNSKEIAQQLRDTANVLDPPQGDVEGT